MVDSVTNSEEYEYYLLRIQKFLLAAENGNLDEIIVRVNEGSDPTLYLHDKTTALHYSAKNAHLDIIQYLLIDRKDLNVDVNFQNVDGDTPLHWLAKSKKCNVELIGTFKFLVTVFLFFFHQSSLTYHTHIYTGHNCTRFYVKEMQCR